MKLVFSLIVFTLSLSGIQAQKTGSIKFKSSRSGQEQLIRPEKSKVAVDSAGANDTSVQGSGMTTAKDIPADKLDKNPNQEENTSKAKTKLINLPKD